MFTTLNINHKERQSIKEKLHLTKTRKFVSQQHRYSTVDFFTTRLTSFSHSNGYQIYRFKENCRLPIIENGGRLVTKYRYLLTLNSVINRMGDTPFTCAVVDPEAHLLFLLPHLLSKCRKVNVYTCATDKYTTENEQLFSLIGSSAVISENFETLKGFDIVFSNIPLPFCDNPRLFGQYAAFATAPPLLPDDIKELSLADDEIFPVLAGLYYIGGVKKLGRLCSPTLQEYDKV